MYFWYLEKYYIMSGGETFLHQLVFSLFYYQSTIELIPILT